MVFSSDSSSPRHSMMSKKQDNNDYYGCFFACIGCLCRFLCLSMPIIVLTEAIIFGIYSYNNPDKPCLVNPHSRTPTNHRSHHSIDATALVITAFKWKFMANILILFLFAITLVAICAMSMDLKTITTEIMFDA